MSRWESGRGLPGLSLLEPPASALQVSVPALLSGELMSNDNRSANILKSKLYVRPICGNLFHPTGNALVACCGITLPPLAPEAPDAAHHVVCVPAEDECCLSLAHPMEKSHPISWMAYCTSGRFELVKLYPEGSAQARFLNRGAGLLCWYCSRHGLFRQSILRNSIPSLTAGETPVCRP